MLLERCKKGPNMLLQTQVQGWCRSVVRSDPTPRPRRWFVQCSPLGSLRRDPKTKMILSSLLSYFFRDHNRIRVEIVDFQLCSYSFVCSLRGHPLFHDLPFLLSVDVICGWSLTSLGSSLDVGSAIKKNDEWKRGSALSKTPAPSFNSRTAV